MTRQIALDTETTGMSPEAGHRVVEIGCVELESRRLTGRRFHYYLNPERDIEASALAAHGLGGAFLVDKPRFAEIEADFIEFAQGAELIIHNAPFDMRFLNHEISRTSSPWRSLSALCPVLDTLKLARRKHSRQNNTLDALCLRYGVDKSLREKYHGALVDAEILAEVYLAMTD